MTRTRTRPEHHKVQRNREVHHGFAQTAEVSGGVATQQAGFASSPASGPERTQKNLSGPTPRQLRPCGAADEVSVGLVPPVAGALLFVVC